jgi:hypothetical protein
MRPRRRFINVCLADASVSIRSRGGSRSLSTIIWSVWEIRALITRAYAVCADETPLRVGAKTPKPERTKAKKYLLVACTDRYTHYLLGDRDLQIADVLGR